MKSVGDTPLTNARVRVTERETTYIEAMGPYGW